MASLVGIPCQGHAGSDSPTSSMHLLDHPQGAHSRELKGEPPPWMKMAGRFQRLGVREAVTRSLDSAIMAPSLNTASSTISSVGKYLRVRPPGQPDQATSTQGRKGQGGICVALNVPVPAGSLCGSTLFVTERRQCCPEQVIQEQPFITWRACDLNGAHISAAT